MSLEETNPISLDLLKMLWNFTMAACIRGGLHPAAQLFFAVPVWDTSSPKSVSFFTASIFTPCRVHPNSRLLNVF